MEGVDLFKGVIVPYINLAVFLGLAVYFFRKPLAKIALDRKEKFSSLSRDAGRMREENEKQNSDLKKRLAGLDARIDQMIETAKADAQAETQRIREDSQKLSEHLQLESKRRAQAEVDKVKAALRKELLGQVNEKLGERLSKDLDQSKHLQLISKGIEEIEMVGRS